MSPLVLALIGCTPSDDPGTPTGSVDTDASDTDAPDTDEPLAGARMNEVRAKSSHNSYERDEALFDQLMWHRVRSLELDIQVDKGGDWPPVAGDWYVHHDGPGDPTTCHRLSDCLVEIGAFHDAVPDHELITVFLDLKADWNATGQSPDDLDARIAARFGPDELLTPSDLLDGCPGAADLRDVVSGACGWPALPSVRGRIAFALTGGGGCAASAKLTQYVDDGATANDRIGFIAPEPSDGCDLDAYTASRRHVVFFNYPEARSAEVADALALGVMSRVWGLNDANAWTRAADAGAHHLGTDKINVFEDPWARTHTSGGWPFDCLEDGCGEEPAELDDAFGLEVQSGDMWEGSDSMALRHTTVDPGVGTATTAFVSVVSSHVEPFAKGCLVARASVDADSASFAVCRPADQNPIRVQIRPSDGASTSAVEVPLNPPDTIDDESVAFLRLVVEPSGSGAIATGYASVDRDVWTEIGSHVFPVWLPIQGLAASAHDAGDPVRFVFGHVRRSVDDGPKDPLGLADLPGSVMLGGASATVFEGAVP